MLVLKKNIYFEKLKSASEENNCKHVDRLSVWLFFLSCCNSQPCTESDIGGASYSC